MAQIIQKNTEVDGVDRRGFLSCMAWAGTGVLYSLSGGVARSQVVNHAKTVGTGLSFVQISDSHMGFNKEANKDVAGTFQAAVDKINALDREPAFLIHTGDISHLSKPEEFDTVDSILKTAKVGKTFFVPGEHDVLGGDNGKSYLERYGKDTQGDGWFSFDSNGAHFIGLVNVLNLKAGGLGNLGQEQLAWLEKNLRAQKSGTPVVIFAHVPLWTVYEQWGWGTEDGMQALALMKRFGSVSVLNGHIHQTVQKVEGNFTFHTACSTAFPQPKPGAAPSPGPMKVPAEQLRSFLGLTKVSFIQGNRSLAILDSDLTPAADDVKIDNFAFNPGTLRVPVGTEVTWANHDDIPHTVVSTKKAFASPVLDTDEKFSHLFDAPGEHSYYCSIHPKMTGKLIVGAA
ncbi:MAG: metallophosphoesterase [Bryobacteraceae bacterium]